MAREIERRFLVSVENLPDALRSGETMTQGYLSFEPVVRVRMQTSEHTQTKQYKLTIKGKGTLVRPEFEYDIPAQDAQDLIAMCGAYTLQKTRYRLGPWELDRFTGRHAGLWLAEIELPAEDTPLPDPRPNWIAREVTYDPRYTNSNLVRMSIDQLRVLLSER